MTCFDGENLLVVFWVVTLCILVGGCRLFGGTFRFIFTVEVFSVGGHFSYLVSFCFCCQYSRSSGQVNIVLCWRYIGYVCCEPAHMLTPGSCDIDKHWCNLYQLNNRKHFWLPVIKNTYSLKIALIVTQEKSLGLNVGGCPLSPVVACWGTLFTDSRLLGVQCVTSLESNIHTALAR